MKLCLYNVENLFLLKEAPGDGYVKPLEKVQWLARTILEIDADIYMLCEVGGRNNLDYFNDKYLNSKYLTCLLPGNSDRGIETGYLINKRVPYFHQILSHKDRSINFNYPHEIKAHEKNNDPLVTHKFSRDISELRLLSGNGPEQKVAFIILLVHLKSKLDKEGIDFNGCLRRKAELKALVETYNQRSEEFPETPIVVCGDFNGNAQRNGHESEFEALYNSSNLDDVLEVIQEPSGLRHSYFYFSKEGQREASQLDYIMLPPALHSKVIKEESGIYHYRDQHGIVLPYPQDSFQRYALPSDHYPLVATLKI